MDKVVIITGAAGNLGKATVGKFLEDGYKIAAVVAPGENFELYQHHPNVDTYVVDLSKESDAENFVNEVVGKYSVIHAALLLVGGYASGGIKDTTGKDLAKMYSLNFETAYFVARPVFNRMVSQHHGRIILVGARPALIASQGKGSLSYALSKSLIFKLAEFINAEGQAHNVTATVLVPSIIDTPQNRQSMPDADFSGWVKPEDIASAMAFVVSDQASPLRETILKLYGNA